MEQIKTCSKCKNELPISDFYKRSNQRDGLDYYCKRCQLAKYKRKHNNPEFRAKAVLRVAAWRKLNPDKTKAGRARYRAKHAKQRADYEKLRRSDPAVKERHNRSSKESTKNLTDSAVRKMLIHTAPGLKAAQITQASINSKREQVMEYRKEQATHKVGTRTCSDCHHVFPLASFYPKSGWCKACASIRYSAYAKRNQQRISTYRAEYQSAHRDSINSSNKQRCRLEVETLHDSYIKKQIKQYTALRSKDIPPSLIKLKRVQLQITRKLKELKK